MIHADVYQQTLYEFFSPVRAFLEDEAVSEIMINGPHQIWVERRGKIVPVTERFDSAEDVLCALRNLAQFVGKRLDERHPLLEARFPDGSRVQAAIAPVAGDGPYVSIRRFQRATFSLARLVEVGTLCSARAELLSRYVRDKRNILVGGGTGSGKTSLLNALTGCIPEDERVVVLEDSREVQVQRPHALSLETRPADARGEGAVSLRDLFRASLRMRPDRIVIGEVRGGEALDLIQAMVSGHGGCLGTVHATHPRDTLTRLETLALMGGLDLPLAALRLQIASGANVLVQVCRGADGARIVTEISELHGYDVAEQRYDLRPVFARDEREPALRIPEAV
jgi:pilus assembly protein CpaF